MEVLLEGVSGVVTVRVEIAAFAFVVPRLPRRGARRIRVAFHHVGVGNGAVVSAVVSLTLLAFFLTCVSG